VTFYIILSLSVFLISLIGTRLTILALRQRTVLLDIPTLRSNHKIPTPRGGGIAVVMAMVIGLLVADIEYGIVLSIFMLAAVSLLDDLIRVPVMVRLLVQILAVLIAVSIIHTPLFGALLPLWLDRLVTVLLWVWFINLFNFMDGIDGLTASEMICISFGLCLIPIILGTFPDQLSIYGMVVAAAGGGFLWWNWRPAKIFLGDVGSIPIGFIVGYLLLLAIQAGFIFPVLILPAYYLCDGGITMLRRLLRGKKIWQAHSDHYYQRAVRSGRRHDAVVCYIIGLNLLLGSLAILSVLDRDLAWLHLAMAYMLVCIILGFFAHTPHDPHNEPF